MATKEKKYKRKDPKERMEELIQDFPKFVDNFYKNPPFNKHQLQGYENVVKEIRESGLKELTSQQIFLDKLYSGWLKWIKMRAANPSKKDCIKKLLDNISPKLIELSQYKLNCPDGEWIKIKTDLKRVFEYLAGSAGEEEGKLKVMNQDSQIVGVSKLLHFLLPDLVPPIDNAYTFIFFGGKQPHKMESDRFLEILDKFRTIIRERKLTGADCKREWDLSVPKLVDNAIVGYYR
jgi:hypothetical protein